MFDLGFARLQPRVRRDVFLVFRYQHRFQRFPIQRAQVGKCGNQHEPQYAMKGHFVKYGAHKNLCKSNNVSTPTSADPTSAPVDANQCLLTASRAGLASDEQLLPKLVAKQTFLSPDVCKINIARLHQTRLVSPDRLFGRGRMNTWPDIGLFSNLVCTSALSPVKPRRRSVTPAAIQICVLAGGSIIVPDTPTPPATSLCLLYLQSVLFPSPVQSGWRLPPSQQSQL